MKREKMSPEQALFVGVFPTGWSFADRRKERGGDWKRVAFLSFCTLKLELERDCPKDLLPLVREFANEMEGRRGTLYRPSVHGNPIVLGSEGMSRAERDRIYLEQIESIWGPA